MHRSLFFSRFLILLLGLASLLQPLSSLSAESSKPTCAFCNPDILEKQSFYEGIQMRALYNYSPYEAGHSMLIPRRHIQRVEDLTEEEILEIFAFIPRLKQAFNEIYEANDFVVLVQNGKNAGQTVGHVHFHIIPRKKANVWTKLRIWTHLLGVWTFTYTPLSGDELLEAITPLRDYFS